MLYENKKINVIFSCDDNPFYYQFWNDISYVWKEIFGFNPILIYVSNEDNNNLSSKYGEIRRVQKFEGIPNYLQGQLARIYFASKEPEKIFMLSDIDIMPINEIYFAKDKIIENIKKNSFYHLNPTEREFGQLPICYYIGYGETFAKLCKNKSWKEFLLSVIKYDFNVDKLNYVLPEHLKKNKLWFSDELFLHSKISQEKIHIIKNNKIINNFERLDREKVTSISMEKIKEYIDCHLPRPYNLYQNNISFLIRCLEYCLNV